MALTKRQREIYDFISNFVQSKGYSPSFDEIGSGMGLRSLATVHNGEIVVALIEGIETTLKRFYREGPKVRLQPANTTMAPIMVAANAVQIQGRVIGVLRKY